MARTLAPFLAAFLLLSLLSGCTTAPAGEAVPPTETGLPPTATPDLTPSATGIPEEIIDEMGVVMRFVPAGEFLMGSSFKDNEKPAAQVYLDAFYIDKYEVTNRHYKACVDQGICLAPAFDHRQTSNYASPDYYGSPGYDNYPVIWVDWQMANTFCAWRGTRLPTEAEWEKAARGTDGRTYPWGENFGCDYANMAIQGEGCVGDTTEAGMYLLGVSPYGLYDMAGNVVEWTSSFYAPYPYDPSDGREDQAVPGSRVIRGGSWFFDGQGLFIVDETWSQTTHRDPMSPTQPMPDMGFRCAVSFAP